MTTFREFLGAEMLSKQPLRVPVADCLTKIPRQPKIKTSEYQNSGAIPVIDQGAGFIGGYIDDLTKIYSGPLPVIVFGDHNRNLKFVKKSFAVGADGTQLLYPDERFDVTYFYYALKAINLRNYGYERHFKYLKEEKVWFWEKPIQRRIAAVLSAYDDLIENNARRIAILEEIVRCIYEEWFVRFRFPGHENVGMVELELGRVPEGWGLVPLGNLVDEVRETVRPELLSPETPYVGLEHIPRRSIALAEWGQAADVQSTKLRFRERDILFGKIRPYFHKVAIAPLPGVASSDAIVIRPKNKDTYGLALAVVSSDAFVAEATQTSNGTKMPRANWNVLRRYPVPIGPEAIMTQFEDLVTSVVSSIGSHVMRNRNLRVTRDLLLPKLISGELDVSAMPDPAATTA